MPIISAVWVTFKQEAAGMCEETASEALLVFDEFK